MIAQVVLIVALAALATAGAVWARARAAHVPVFHRPPARHRPGPRTPAARAGIAPRPAGLPYPGQAALLARSDQQADPLPHRVPPVGDADTLVHVPLRRDVLGVGDLDPGEVAGCGTPLAMGLPAPDPLTDSGYLRLIQFPWDSRDTQKAPDVHDSVGGTCS